MHQEIHTMNRGYLRKGGGGEEDFQSVCSVSMNACMPVCVYI